MFDIVINSGKVFTGGDKAPEIQNIGIIKDKIEFCGPEIIKGVQEIDAKGFLVTPGFIDLHTHSDLSFLVDPEADSKITQGVTFELMGNCGMSFCAPLTPETKLQLKDRMDRQGLNIIPDWDGFDGYLNTIEKNNPSINVAAQIGHGTLRTAVMGMNSRYPTPDDTNKMKYLLETAINDGVLGFSTGLWYAPGSYSHTEEIIDLANISAQNNLLYSSHIRSESDDACGLFPAHSEAIEIARRSGSRVQISHVKSVGPKFWGRGNELISGIIKAREEGLDVAGDQYPYFWSSTPISGCMFPRWSLEGGREKTLARLKDLDLRNKIKNETTSYINRFHGAEGCVLADYAVDSSLEGLSLLQISKKFKSTPEEAVMKLYEKSEGSLILHSMEEKDIYDIAQYKYMAIASDGNSLRSTGPLSSGKPHPRSYGTNSRFLEHIVNRKKIVTLEDAIFRMTKLPAERIGLKKRGQILKGFFADLNIFKLEEIKENGTFKNPHQYSEGMKYVIVNGKISVIDGKKIAGRNGRVVRSFDG